jgi:hypothetical protein
MPGIQWPFPMLTLGRTCPRCCSWDIFKSRFRTLEFILPLLLLRPVRCGDCYMRLYRPVFYPTLIRKHSSQQPIKV